MTALIRHRLVKKNIEPFQIVHRLTSIDTIAVCKLTTLDIKNQPNLCYIDKREQSSKVTLSQKAVDFSLGELCKNPRNILTEFVIY
ncbi:hypothetical protein [Parasutterella muris]|uniref:hypothetical protein n=1 Tax=Parasutterella muris TaxID=2565572 RepID=UPI00345DEE83